MFCPNCGSANEEGARFCPACGVAIPGVASAQAGHAGPQVRPPVVTLLAVLKGISALLWVAGALALFAFAGSSARAGALTAVAVIVLALGVARGVCAYGLWTLRPYGRALQIVLSYLGLLVFPIQTVISIVILVYMFRPGMRVVFSGTRVEDLTEAEKGHLRPLYGSSATAIVVVVCVAVPAFVAFTGIIAAIAVPNALNAIDRGKQKRTIADLRTISSAMDRYAAVHHAFPVASSTGDLQTVLQPKYVKLLPVLDGWNHPIQVDAAPSAYTIYSFGKDGAGSDCTPARTHTFNDQICLVSGQFVRYPDGVQSGDGP